ncbi:MAG TPA: NAD(P)-binding domain-containing protein, partial [Chloroflexota bacterium]
MESVRTIIVGAGKAGLALSYYLTQAGHEHLILERGRVAERWRSERWDSFTLLSPNWHSRLAGYCYTGPDPDGFMDRSEIVDYLQSYADSFGAPVRSSSEVTSARRNEVSGRHLVEVNHGEHSFEAENLVVAIGGFQRPHLIPLQSSFPTDLFQIHTNDYRNPDQLPTGAVLVVGSGTSGQQIAEELNHSGRRVFLSVGQHAKLPRRYRGRDIVWWLDATGFFDQTSNAASASDRRPSAALTGVGGGHDLDLRQLAVDGVQLLGHLRSVAGNRLEFAPDL